MIKRTTELVFMAKQAVDELGARACYQIQQKLHALGGLMPALDTRANGAIMQICSEFPDDTKQILKTSSKADIEQVTEKIVKECCDNTGNLAKSVDEVVEVLEGGTSAKGLIGHDFEDYLTKIIGGDSSFSVGGES